MDDISMSAGKVEHDLQEQVREARVKGSVRTLATKMLVEENRQLQLQCLELKRALLAKGASSSRNSFGSKRNSIQTDSNLVSPSLHATPVLGPLSSKRGSVVLFDSPSSPCFNESAASCELNVSLVSGASSEQFGSTAPSRTISRSESMRLQISPSLTRSESIASQLSPSLTRSESMRSTCYSPDTRHTWSPASPNLERSDSTRSVKFH